MEAVRELDVPRTTLQTLVRRGIVELSDEAAAFHMSGMKPRKLEFLFTPAQKAALDSHHRLRRRAEVSAHAAARRDRLGQDRGVSVGNAGGAGEGTLGHPAGSGDRSHAGHGRRSAPDFRRRGRHPSFRPERRRARRAVEAHPQWRVPHGGRHALGHLRAGARSGAHRGRRRARPLLQAGGDAALPRSRRRGDAGQDVQRRRGAGLGHSVAGDLLQRGAGQVSSAGAAGAHREAAAAGSRNPRHARGIPAHPQRRSAVAQAGGGDWRAPGAQRAGHGAAEPARLLGVRALPRMRRDRCSARTAPSP